MKEKKSIEKLTDKELIELGRNIQHVYETGYLRVSKMYWLTFTKGIVYGFGIFLGGTLVVALVAWVVGFFDQVPLLQQVIDVIRNTMDASNTLPKA